MLSLSQTKRPQSTNWIPDSSLWPDHGNLVSSLQYCGTALTQHSIPPQPHWQLTREQSSPIKPGAFYHWNNHNFINISCQPIKISNPHTTFIYIIPKVKHCPAEESLAYYHPQKLAHNYGLWTNLVRNRTWCMNSVDELISSKHIIRTRVSNEERCTLLIRPSAR